MSNYAEVLKKLLPSGSAWTQEEESNLQNIIKALANNFDNVQEQADNVPYELIPSSSSTLLDEWLEVVDEDISITDGEEAKSAYVLAKMASRGGCSINYFKTLAQSLGFEIEHKKPYPLKAGMGSAGDRIYSDDWIYCFIIETTEQLTRYFRSGVARVGERLQSDDEGSSLKKIINIHKQAHTYAIFDI